SLYKYMLSVSVRQTEVLKRLREETSRFPMAEMQISPEQGQLMSLLVKLLGASRAMEVGVFTGYSSLCVAMVLPPSGKLIACDINREWTDVARRYWRDARVDSIVELHLAPALETMDRLLAEDQGGTIDFLFIDADKENYPAYYDRGLRLLRTGGLMAIDNVFWDGKVADRRVRDRETRAIRELNDRIKADERVDVTMIPIGDGLTLARKRM
ncbi:MAG TPA: class I SAM-dependent methyltransferase, partial [Thermodesulfobacteriota bacterium]|nr:class I SAM-dependent methyltransferase [Thermodesulfobacteriota bacterium]